MAKSKTTKKPTSNPKRASSTSRRSPATPRRVPSTPGGSVYDPGVEVELLDYEEASVGSSDLSAGDRQFLVRSARFLVAIQSPRFVGRALKAGYSGAEHTLGLELWNKAAGRDRPFEHYLEAASVDTSLVDPERLGRLRRLDSIENRFFPIARTVIARFVPKATRARFDEAFFKDLQQQPLGPLVVDSVKTFLTRYAALATSSEPGARAVFEQLRQRGLSEGLVAEALGLIAGLEALGPLPVISRSREALAAARRAQVEALEELRLFWHDWSTALRPMYGVREQVVLGLAEVKAAARADEPLDPDGPDQPDQPAGPPAP